MKHIALLVVHHVAENLLETYGEYLHQFRKILEPFSDQISLHGVDLLAGERVNNVTDYDGYLITGSHFGVYESFEWLEHLFEIIRNCHNQEVPLVGICFGHQAIAQAMGGNVEKASQGWGIGVSKNQVIAEEPWMKPYQQSFKLLVSHQDQVVQLPKDTEVLASSDFCPNYIIQHGSLLGIQGHPEFVAGYSRELILSRKDIIPTAVVKQGLASLQQPVDTELITSWMVEFLKLKSK